MLNPSDLDTLFSGANSTFLADLYALYLKDPAAVDPSWRQYFSGLSEDVTQATADARGASWAPRPSLIGSNGGPPMAAAMPPPGAYAAVAYPPAYPTAYPTAYPAAYPPPMPPPGVSPAQLRSSTLDSIRALMMIRAYRVRGHLMAVLDPLGLEKRAEHPELDPRSYGFTNNDFDRPIFIDNVLGLETATLRQIVAICRSTYCGHIGVEFMHIQYPDQKSWIQERIEGIRNQPQFTHRGKRAILEKLTQSEVFERFCEKKYVGTKRFGIEGGESLIPALEQIVKRGGQLGVRELVIGMPHRGRLNVLVNFMAKSYAAMFSEFQGVSANPEDVQGSGDVKYHLGTSSDREFDKIPVHLSLTANPSHLEAVNPVVLGKARAKQTQRQNLDRDQVMSVLIHGDAAFAGQGLVAETLALSELRGYRVGGTIHFIVNNQIGFTTSPTYARSSPYPTDVAKMVMAPIFHVNGDDPEAVVHVTRIATEFRQRFKKDVVIDMFCYRRHGHNEADEPAFTQPLMYRTIAKHPTTRQIYGDRLVSEDILAPNEPDEMVNRFWEHLEEQFQAARSYRPNKADWLEGKWAGLEPASGDDRRGNTAVSLELLREVGLGFTHIPPNVHPHRTLKRVIDARRKAIETGEGIDWSTAEALAFGTLLVEGTPVRLSGQDCGRGTFSQRHSVIHDQESEERYIPLNHIRPQERGGQEIYEVIDSLLSEAGVLGFEYGYSLAEPHALVMWEAQFGDFANGAQVIIDQFLSSGESKWLRMSGLVMLLPHGMEGQGPEHSSARLERYLQLCAEDNMQVVYPSTPASYFHVLRRQIRRNFRKPLIVMTPKSLLRHKSAVSKLSDMGPGTSFHRLITPRPGLVPDAEMRRVVLCSGKVYYDLYEEREKRGLNDVAILRIEQLYPFPKRNCEKHFARYRHADVVWCQEEPRNMGAWNFVQFRLEEVLASAGGVAKRPRYVGRPEMASPAAGSYKRHLAEQARLVEEALVG